MGTPSSTNAVAPVVLWARIPPWGTAAGVEWETWILHQLHRHRYGSPLAEAACAPWALSTSSCPLFQLSLIFKAIHETLRLGYPGGGGNKNQKQQGKCSFSKRMKWEFLLLSKFLTSCCPWLSVPEHALPSALPDPKPKAPQKTCQEPLWAITCPITGVTACLGEELQRAHLPHHAGTLHMLLQCHWRAHPSGHLSAKAPGSSTPHSHRPTKEDRGGKAW